MENRKYPYMVSDGIVLVVIRNDDDLRRWRASTRVCAGIILAGMIVCAFIVARMVFAP